MGGADSFLFACSSLPTVSALLWFPNLNYVLFSSKIKPYFNHSSLLAQNSQKKSTFIYRDTMPKLTQSKPYAQGSISLLGSHKNNHLIHFLKDFEKLYVHCICFVVVHKEVFAYILPTQIRLAGVNSEDDTAMNTT